MGGLCEGRGSCNKRVKINRIHVYIWYVYTYGHRHPTRCELLADGKPPFTCVTELDLSCYSSQPGLLHIQMEVKKQVFAPVLANI